MCISEKYSTCFHKIFTCKKDKLISEKSKKWKVNKRKMKGERKTKKKQPKDTRNKNEN